MLGTPRKTVAPCRAIAWVTSLGSKRATGTRAKPCSKGVSIPTVAAKAWNMGNTTSTRSSWVKLSASATLAVLASRLAWVSIAPLGRPVVPEV